MPLFARKGRLKPHSHDFRCLHLVGFVRCKHQHIGVIIIARFLRFIHIPAKSRPYTAKFVCYNIHPLYWSATATPYSDGLRFYRVYTFSPSVEEAPIPLMEAI